jgi:D-3-phosphoglycerate dehydrogenase / 2-oxoglutarate reductase
VAPAGTDALAWRPTAGPAALLVPEVGDMRILFADNLDEQTVRDLEAHGHECAMEPGLSAEDLPKRIQGFDALVVRSTKVPRAVFEAADRLVLVVRAGAGTNTIDTDAAAERAVFVSNVPGRNAAAVAELTMGLLLAVDRRIADNVADLREGRWDKKAYGKAEGLLGSTMGILGLGSIGFLVAERAAAFGIRVQSVAKEGRAAAAVARAEELGITMCDSLEELLGSSDIVSLHLPASPETKHLVDETFLGRMRRGAILLNTSRGDVVDEAALLEALEEGRVRAGLDVFDGEPGSGQAEWASPLAQHPRVVATHHIGASTAQAQRAIAQGVAEIVDAFSTGEVRHCVNLDPDRLGSIALTVRHLDRVGVLAQVLDQLSAAHLNVQHMVNRVFRGGEAAVAFIDVEGRASAELLEDLRAIPHVLGVSVVTLDDGAPTP